ncbi:MarR family winged helix-turn-helix transcriptional regulator [Tellurirhabdus rosea]|uniref:MarR family winged helix-turn-helix transcriptional regulator n=1 Tax=Tellurirhabdus rosea TaxID=2674997 RepID=UPI0022538C8E|nr:MarR family winged helix-turn-helix transcriptional regulator [Tellurirhabdus rosea]
MDSGKDKLLHLIQEWAAFDREQPEGDLTAFCTYYLTNRTGNSPEPGGNPVNAKWVELVTEPKELTATVTDAIVMKPESRISALLGRLIRYMSFYSKKAMQPLELSNIDDAVYLIVLAQMGTPKKSELIHEMLSEFPSGIDIIKRLMAKGLAEEFPDEHDRRSKRVRITEKGIETLQTCLPEMDKVAQIGFHILTEAEKQMLISVFTRLDRYHADYYKSGRNQDFRELYGQIIS